MKGFIYLITNLANGKKYVGYRGVPMSAEWRRNISASHMGKTMPAATRSKISSAKKGHPVSEETRRKISAARKRRSDPDA